MPIQLVPARQMGLVSNINQLGRCLLAALLLISTQNSIAETLPLTLDRTVQKDIYVAHLTQNREESWDGERQALEVEIAKLTEQKSRLKDKVDALLWRNEKTQKQVERLSDEVKKSTHLTEGLAPVISQQSQVAHQIFDTSLPFLKEERAMRLAALDDWLKAPGTEQAEKLERLLEFFTIESEYGHTSEAWQETINLRGKQRAVDILRVGRLALFYLTPDEQDCGAYNPQTHTFDPVSGSCADLKKAVALANRERSAELVALPVGGIKLP